MGTFTALTSDDFVQLANQWQLGAVLGFEALAAGTINSNFIVRLERNRRIFVRVNEGKCEADVAWEAELVTVLANAGVPTPIPLRARDGRPYVDLHGKWLSAFPAVDGVHLEQNEVTPAHAAALGRSLAMMHLAAAASSTPASRPSRYDFSELASRLATIAAAADPFLADAVAILRDELAWLAAHSAQRNAATTSTIHGDLFRDNVLWQRDASPPVIAALIDFEQASTGSVAYDLAVCLNDWCWADGPMPEVAGALIEGYQAVRRLSAADRVALPIEVRAAAARFTITRITDVYLAKVANPHKDFRDFLARVRAWRGPGLGRFLSSV